MAKRTRKRNARLCPNKFSAGNHSSGLRIRNREEGREEGRVEVKAEARKYDQFRLAWPLI